MTAQEMAQQIKNDPRLAGLDVDVIERRNQVVVYGFHQTADLKVTKAILESLGFGCGPNSGRWNGVAPQSPFIGPDGKLDAGLLDALNH